MGPVPAILPVGAAEAGRVNLYDAYRAASYRLALICVCGLSVRL